MKNDIVDRLRDGLSDDPATVDHLMCEAANEIERLRHDLDTVSEANNIAAKEVELMRREIEHLNHMVDSYVDERNGY